MVAKGLKVGDIFKDGNCTYRVDKVLKNGTYISNRISVEEAEKAAEKAVKEPEEVGEESKEETKEAAKPVRKTGKK